jgi:hypothetical protein
MTLFLGFFTAVLLPVLYTGIPNPVWLRWYVNHGAAPMPAALKLRAERVGNTIPFVVVFIVAVMLGLLLSRSGVGPDAVGLTAHDWQPAVVKGVLSGVSWLGIYVIILFLLTPSVDALSQHLAVRYGFVLWMSLSFAAAVVEEIWRAFCLVALSDLSVLAAVGFTALAFGLAHRTPLGRAVSATCFSIYASWLFLQMRSLWVTVTMHAVVNVGTFFLIQFVVSQKQKEASGNEE